MHRFLIHIFFLMATLSIIDGEKSKQIEYNLVISNDIIQNTEIVC